ncbi:MAG: threonine transporter [Planctomycetaceae bacterium]|nr:threonine transporter [Planctomycetaceae bacterium]
MSNNDHQHLNGLFNTPLEIGLRCLILLVESHRPCDLQRLKILDYFLLHSGDLANGPESLHPLSPLQAGEFLVKRALLEKGLRLLIAKDLVQTNFTRTGITYEAGDHAKTFLSYFDSAYAKKARSVARWVSNTFSSIDDEQLQAIVNRTIGRWRAEFEGESIAEEEE